MASSRKRTVVEKNGALRVAGSRVVGSSGNGVQLAGVSLYWSNTKWDCPQFYTQGVVDKLVDDWRCTIVRAAMGVDEPTGYFDDPEGNMARVRVVVEAAISRGIYVIIDWHSHHAEKFVEEAKAFFETMARRYGSYENVVFEIYNEPIHTPWSTQTANTTVQAADTIKGYAEQIIPVIRKHSSNLVVVGTRFYSLYVWEAALDPLAQFDDVAYTSHFYAGHHKLKERSFVRKGILGKDYVPADGEAEAWTDDQRPTPVAVFVTEWAAVDQDGDGNLDEDSAREWLDFCDAHGISLAAWSVCDRKEGSAALAPGADPAGDWSASDYTPSGNFVRSILLDYANGRRPLFQAPEGSPS
ncbi:hypothetical protein CTAYLR_000628 [Chrysophaeum taylorii]|uniref:Glycoside hydrolase family 5 domain-containing protein n=1 Tax=Chrysophaeum taylorii TaxID=2483200 RepID=A0AAD7UAT5_9STRA|nr:hypothetical protein CTAYLR_000628 [Chrysophaeum taylorii]